MSETLIVGFDDTEASHRALAFAARTAMATGAIVHVVHILEWSTYSFLTAQELEERHKRRTEELSRAAELVTPVVQELKAQGIQATSDVRYGHAAELICEIAEQKLDAQIVIGRAGGFVLARRMLGGMALALMQASPVPVTVVP
jgi:nucleotide-binding universal stress UspA family protein